MSLEKCNCCNRNVSSNANNCPHCGEPNPTYTDYSYSDKGDDKSYVFCTKYSILLGIIIGPIIIYLFYANPNDDSRYFVSIVVGVISGVFFGTIVGAVLNCIYLVIIEPIIKFFRYITKR